MTFTEEQRTEFESLSRPLIEWLNKNGHPHMEIIIDNTGAVIAEGLLCYHTEEFLQD